MNAHLPAIRCYSIRLADTGAELTQAASSPAEAVRLACAGTRWFLRETPRAARLGEWIATVEGGRYGPFEVVVTAQPMMAGAAA